MNMPTVSIIIPHLTVEGDDRREKGLQRCIESIRSQDYPLTEDGQSKLEILFIDGPETVPEKVKMGVEQTTGEYIVYAANDMWFEPGAIQTAVLSSLAFNKAVVAFNDGMVLPDKGNICCHFAIRRDFIPLLKNGEVFDCRYHHLAVDNFLHAQAVKSNQFLRSESAIVHHDHFSKGGKMDAVYARGWSHIKEDRALLKQDLKELYESEL